MRVCLALIELSLVAAALGCQQPTQPTKDKQAPPTQPSATELTRALVPRAASRFHEQAGQQRQAHPRLPDTGEWRCAERERTVWCAGGEAAAGVVQGPLNRGYRCAARWGQNSDERVCIDQQPDYPGEGYQCRFEQERGIARVCEFATAATGPALPATALPACWLDRDCPSDRCDRGACTCTNAQQCSRGSCQNGVCSEVKP